MKIYTHSSACKIISHASGIAFKMMTNYRYDADYNGYVDHGEFLQRLGVDISPGDVNGVSNQITKGSEDEIYRHHHNQQV